ncbi:site-2 protease family protein [Candidatus Uhrbacteria bacterium]|nr:site-2 protease family protein [Candidatus Uhrbacteria bacterium]
MPFNLLFEQPVIFFVWVLAIVIALSAHEFSHAWVGASLGDATARDAGRLTLNPLAHLDPLGFLMLLVAGFGWGRPVPLNPYNLRYPRWGPTLVALAGPAANLILLLAAGIALKMITATGNFPLDNLLVQFLGLLVVINLVLLLFNLLPIPPLDGSKLLFSLLAAPRFSRTRFLLETRGPLILLSLIILDNLFRWHLLGRLFSGIIDTAFQVFT